MAAKPLSLPPAVETYIQRNVGQGKFPSLKQLRRVAQSSGSSVTDAELRRYTKYFKHLAQIASKPRRRKGFMTSPLPLLGYVFIDLAFYRPEWKRFNKGKVGFVVAVDASTQQLACVAVKGKTKADWAEAVKAICDTSALSLVRTIVSDMEPALFSRHFRETLARERNVGFVFLKANSKAFLAESKIRQAASDV